jgi:uncharacterized cupredoxin-like copper-binding protein
MFRVAVTTCLALAALLAAACAGSGEGGREIIITQTADGCAPASVEVTTGEKLKLTARNESGKTYELEGTNGTQLEEILIPEGRTRSVGYTVPGEEGAYDVKCYQPGGKSTIIKLVATADGAAGADGSAEATEGGDGTPLTIGGNSDPADDTVTVELTEYEVSAGKLTVESGNIEFKAVNASEDQVHELAVLEVRGAGGFDVIGEIEDMPPGARGSVRLKLEAGSYELACLIVPGEEGSTTDHYAEGMHTAFTVE